MGVMCRACSCVCSQDCGTCITGSIHLCCDLSPQDLPTPPRATCSSGALRSAPRPGRPLGQPTSYLLTASHHAAAEVATGLGVDHGGDVIFALEVCEVQLSPLSLLPVDPSAQSQPAWLGPRWGLGQGLGWGVGNRAGAGLGLGGQGGGPAQGSSSPLPKVGAILLLGLCRMYGSNMSPSQGLPTHPLKARHSSCSLASIPDTVVKGGSVLRGGGDDEPFSFCNQL